MNNNILLVRVPAQESVDGRELRDYILESISKGVLVLTEEAACEVMELPPLGGVEVVTENLPEDPGAESTDEPALSPVGGEEKRAILQRLKDYRAAHGLGKLEAVSQKTSHRKNDRISSDTLRMLLTGDTRLDIREWRKIGRALDMLEGGDG